MPGSLLGTEKELTSSKSFPLSGRKTSRTIQVSKRILHYEKGILFSKTNTCIQLLLPVHFHRTWAVSSPRKGKALWFRSDLKITRRSQASAQWASKGPNESAGKSKRTHKSLKPKCSLLIHKTWHSSEWGGCMKQTHTGRREGMREKMGIFPNFGVGVCKCESVCVYLYVQRQHYQDLDI